MGIKCNGLETMACSHLLVDELSTAAVRGDIDKIKQILESGSVDVNAINHYGRTALQVMKASRADVAEMLLRAGANPNIMDFSQHVPSHTRVTPAHDVARQGYLDTLRCLVKYGADVTLRDAAGNTPAHLAAKHGHYHVVRYLSHAIDLHQWRNRDGLSPLDLQNSAKRRHLRKWLTKARTSPAPLCSIACQAVRSAMGTNRLGHHSCLPVPRRLQELVSLQVTPAGHHRNNQHNHHHYHLAATSSSFSSFKENKVKSSNTTHSVALKRAAANRLSPLS